MTATTDLKPGDIVQHPEHGNGLVGGSNQVVHLDRDGFLYADADFTGWERVETCTTDERRILDDFHDVQKGESPEVVYPEAGVTIAGRQDWKHRPELVKPGHVQVRVDDLDTDSSHGRIPAINRLYEIMRAESHKEPAQPDEPQEFGARIRVNGMQYLRSGIAPRPFVDCYGNRASWNELLTLGTVTLGWGEDQ